MVCVTTRHGEMPTSLPVLPSNSSSVIELKGSTPFQRTSLLEERHAMLHRLAAVDRKDGSGDIAAGQTAQIQCCAGNVTRRADPADGNAAGDAIRLFVRAGGEGGHPALERPRREGI